MINGAELELIKNFKTIKHRLTVVYYMYIKYCFLWAFCRCILHVFIYISNAYIYIIVNI
jgi:hypothetical protein